MNPITDRFPTDSPTGSFWDLSQHRFPVPPSSRNRNRCDRFPERSQATGTADHHPMKGSPMNTPEEHTARHRDPGHVSPLDPGRGDQAGSRDSHPLPAAVSEYAPDAANVPDLGLARVSRDDLLLSYDRLSREHVELRAEVERLRGPFRCCEHCKDDTIHDVEPNQHDVSCQLCDDVQARRAEAAEAELRTLREVARVGVELDNHHNAAVCPYCTPALLASSPAETTGEAE